MIKYVIEEASTIKAGDLYLLVSFQSSNNQELGREDFIIGRPEMIRVYTGPEGPNGEILDPNAYQESVLDMRSEIRQIISNYIQAHPEISAGGGRDNTDPTIARSQADPRGQIEQIADLIGKSQRP